MLVFKLVCAICVVATIATSADIAKKQKQSLPLKFSSSLKSKPRDFFDSDESFVNAHNDLQEKIKSKDYEDYGKTHTFFVQHRDGCDWTCHKPIMEQLAADSSTSYYKIMSPNRAQISATMPQLERLYKKFPKIMSAHIPLIPESKICSSVYDVHKQYAQSSTSIDQPACIDQKLRVNMAPLSREELVNYLRTLDDLSPVAQVLDLNHLLDTHVESEDVTFFVEVADCDHMLGVAKRFAQSRLVTWLEYQAPVVLHNRWSKGLCETGKAYNAPMSENNVTGEGEVIGVTDTGIDMFNGYFYDPDHETPYNHVNMSHRKVVQYLFVAGQGDGIDNGDAHGTHVAGSAAGKAYDDRGSLAHYNGMAKEAKISFFDIKRNTSDSITLPGNLNTIMYTPMLESGAKMITNSWGTEGVNSYESNCANADLFLWNNPEAMLFFSAGNSGRSSNTVNAPATAKNVVSVGASLNDKDSFLAYAATDVRDVDDAYDQYTIAYFSSRGPTADGRLKPDILAPGFWVTSAKGYSYTSSLYYDVNGLLGTSMSSPTAAGFALKIRQYFTKGFYPSGSNKDSDAFLPSGSLVKAMLVASAIPMTFDVLSVDTNDQSVITSVATLTAADYPSKEQGYGRIRMSNVLNFAQSESDPISLFVVGSAYDTEPHYAAIAATNQVDEYTFKTSTSGSQTTIRVVLAYTDYPGSAFSSDVMINDLAITVTANGGSTVYTPMSDSDAPTTSNVQVIDIDTPTANTEYTVNVFVDGDLSVGPQPYSVVVVQSESLTYLPDDIEDINYENQLKRTYVSTGAAKYIAMLSILCFLLLVQACWGRRLRKKIHENHVHHHHHKHNDKDMNLHDLHTGSHEDFAFIPDVDVPPDNAAPPAKKQEKKGWFGGSSSGEAKKKESKQKKSSSGDDKGKREKKHREKGDKEHRKKKKEKH